MLIDKYYRLMDKAPIRGLILIVALMFAACVFWDLTVLRIFFHPLPAFLILIWGLCHFFMS
ncbi:hypothetical protein [Photorhabdus namnaonensis]|uniref:Uncharacterized protein n=1 Tax=Photorhabdus namnaonensis TaxID=1851568 RepID=A0A1B8YHC1_9GAMM|nr:hypothetical protein Phpb_02421 [Photorhabdus namnaonensis]